MYKNKRNFAIKLEIDEKINSIKDINNSSYKEELNNLLELGLEKIDYLERIKLLEKQIESISKLLSINFELSKQIYADLNFPIKDIKTSEAVNSFLNKKRVGRFNE